MNKIYIEPKVDVVDKDTGIGRVIIAQYKFLETIGWQITYNVNEADLVAAHVRTNLKDLDILFCHGLYFADIPNSHYNNYHYKINTDCISSIRRARRVIVPSDWVAQPFRRDMRIKPAVIGHGIDLDLWQPGNRYNYILWNKGRNDDVCDATPAYELAKRGHEVFSTFYPKKINQTVPGFHVIGFQPHQQMKLSIQRARIYLATTIETFGIGTLEAMACGVPILGYDWGGTADIVSHKRDGYLVRPGDIDGLEQGIEYINKHYERLSEHARNTAEKYDWREVIKQYGVVFEQVLHEKRNENKKVSIIITNYNYGKYVGDAIQSCIEAKPDEIIVVDDGSTDNSREVIEKYPVKTLFKENQGVASARNDGIAMAEGAYITLLDADDKIEPAFVKILKKSLDDDRELGIAYTSLRMIDEEGNSLGVPGFPPEFDWEVQAQGGVPPGNCIPSACMFRKSMWERAGGQKQQYAPGEDAEFWTRGLSVGFTAKRITTQPLFIYRNHARGASKTKKYVPIDTWLPWIKDKIYPLGSPAKKSYHIYSYVLPQVSVIIPVGPGHDKYLETAINSVIGQNFRFWEIVVVDDTIEGINAKIRLKYPFLRVFRTEGKTGAGHARNIGIDNAKAPLVLFLDADDFISSNFLQEATDLYAKTGKYVYCNTISIDKNGKREEFKASDFHRDLFIKDLRYLHGVTALVPTHWAKCIRFDEDLPFFEDSEFYARIAYDGGEGVLCEGIYLFYNIDTSTRRSNDSLKNKEINDKIVSNIDDLRKRGIKMGCCGNSSQATLDFLKFRASMNQIQLPKELEEKIVGDTIRMKYIAENTGGISFRLPSGKTVIGANNATNRFVDVTIEDARYLANMSNKWQVVEREPEPVIPEPMPWENEPELEQINKEFEALTEDDFITDEMLVVESLIQKKVGEVKEFIADCDDEEVLFALLEEDERKTVRQAIEDRLDELSE